MCQLTVQPILQIAHEEPVQYGHFLKLSHTHMNDHKGRKSGEFTGLSLVSVSVSVSIVQLKRMRNQDVSWKEQSRIVLVGVCIVCKVCVPVHIHTNVLRVSI